MRDLILKALSCQPVTRRPVWLMRQAGRYLPEYLKLRQKHSLFNCFHEPELAEEITYMPLKRFDLDAAILFSDLLVLVEVWGKKAVYPEGSAPYISPSLEKGNELFIPSEEEMKEKLSYVFQTIALLRLKLSVPLIGFCGAPFTLLCYLLKGSKSRDFSEVKKWMIEKKEELPTVLDKIAKTCILFAKLQIEAGAQAFQFFDSWADMLSKEEFALYVLPYWKQMKDALKPFGVPVIFFSRANSLYPDEIAAISPDCISFDEQVSLASLRQRVPKTIAVQGNFSQDLLASGSVEEVRRTAQEMVNSLGKEQGVIWNLGHGILPKTPIENVEALMQVLLCDIF